jgi:hypothetical protein
MPIINTIPERYIEGFKALIALSDEAFETIKVGLSNAPYSSSIEILSETLNNLDDEINILEIFESIGSLMSFLDDRELVNDVIQSILTVSLDEELINEDQASQFGKRIEYLLNNRQLYLASKSEDLIFNYSNKYFSSRIVSDIRPVFNMDISEDPSACLIIHNLNIHYQSQDEPFHKDILVSLNSDDLNELIKVLERAQKKDLSIKKMISKNGMKIIEE